MNHEQATPSSVTELKAPRSMLHRRAPIDGQVRPQTRSVNVAVVGLGYWGPNLARTIAGIPDAKLYALCDSAAERLQRLSTRFPNATVFEDYAELLACSDVEAIVIATPAHTHGKLARAALKAGKHVLVEKPLAQSRNECEELIQIAEDSGLILMAGHVFVYNAAVQKIKEYIQSGMLGRIYYIYSQRLNLGIVRQDVNALWNFAPHDVSIINYWLGTTPEAVSAHGYSFLQSGIEDVVFMTMEYPQHMAANVHISWLDPHKVRRMTVVGSEKMIVYDDVSTEYRIMIHDKGVTRRAMENVSQSAATPSLGRFETFGEFQLLVRAGDVVIPKVDFVEPLQVECQHFVQCIHTRTRPLTDGRAGLQVVNTLEAAQQSLKSHGRRIEVRS